LEALPRPPSAAYRLAVLAALAATWWWVKTAHPVWIAAVADWLRTRPYLSDRSAMIVSATLLTTYAVFVVAAMCNPWRARHAYDDALRAAVLTLILLLIAATGGLLAVGWFFQFGALIKSIGVVTVLLTVQIAVGLVVEGVKAMKKG
jgi:hypothetical protein